MACTGDRSYSLEKVMKWLQLEMMIAQDLRGSDTATNVK